MLPYAPLHHLLLADLAELGVEALVLTSGNVSDEPIAFRDGDALRAARAHRRRLPRPRPPDRDAHGRLGRARRRARPAAAGRSRCGARAATCRRASTCPFAAPQAAARVRRPAQGDVLPRARAPRVGEPPHRRPRALPGAARLPAGDRPLRAPVRAAARAASPTTCTPTTPRRRSRSSCDGVELTGVQHHHAHLAACLAEHGLEGPAVGAIYDGSGYGTDGTIWGGEILVGDLVAFERAASLRPVRMPGGDARRARAVADGLRVARSGAAARRAALPDALAGTSTAAAGTRSRSIGESAAVSPETTSMGRLFDAVAALCGLRAQVLVRGSSCELSLRLAPGRRDGARLRRCRSATRAGAACSIRAAAIRAIAARRRPAGVPRRRRRAGASTRASRSPPRAACARGRRAPRARRSSCSPAACSRTGCCSSAPPRCSTAAGLRVLVPERLPPNDGGIAFGQAAVAAARDRAGAL